MRLFHFLKTLILEIRFMNAIDKLNAAVAALNAAVPVAGARIDALKAAGANAGANDAAIDAAADAVNAAAAALVQAAS